MEEDQPSLGHLQSLELASVNADRRSSRMMNTGSRRVLGKAWMLMVAGTFLAGSPSRAEHRHDEPSGHLQGTVTDQSGGVIPEAKVFFRAGESIYSATTGANGVYEVTLPAGTYAVDVKKAGFCYRRAPLRVQACYISHDQRNPPRLRHRLSRNFGRRRNDRT